MDIPDAVKDFQLQAMNVVHRSLLAISGGRIGKTMGNMAVYNCQAGSNGFYAQCDGALCFTSTQATEFPFFGQLAAEEIICSCPITAAADSGLAFSTTPVANSPAASPSPAAPAKASSPSCPPAPPAPAHPAFAKL